MRTQCHYVSIYVLENAIDGDANLLNLFHSGRLTGFGRKSTGKHSGNVGSNTTQLRKVSKVHFDYFSAL